MIGQLDGSWIDELCDAVGLDNHDLPVLWDIDFIATDEQGYALCEINVNSVSPPPGAPIEDIATALATRLTT